MKRAFLLLSLLLFSQCSLLNKPENNDGDTALALLLGISAGCVIGGQAFTPSAGVTCSGGTASGTGTLTATTAKEDISLRIYPSFSGSSSISIFAMTSASNVAAGITAKITHTGVAYQIAEQHNLQSLGPVFFASSLCYEVHGDHGHVFVKADSGCTGPHGAEADFVSAFSASGASWGFVLDNAMISGLTVQSEPGLTH